MNRRHPGSTPVEYDRQRERRQGNEVQECVRGMRILPLPVQCLPPSDNTVQFCVALFAGNVNEKNTTRVNALHNAAASAK